MSLCKIGTSYYLRWSYAFSSLVEGSAGSQTSIWYFMYTPVIDVASSPTIDYYSLALSITNVYTGHELTSLLVEQVYKVTCIPDNEVTTLPRTVSYMTY